MSVACFSIMSKQVFEHYQGVLSLEVSGKKRESVNESCPLFQNLLLKTSICIIKIKSAITDTGRQLPIFNESWKHCPHSKPMIIFLSSHSLVQTLALVSFFPLPFAILKKQLVVWLNILPWWRFIVNTIEAPSPELLECPRQPPTVPLLYFRLEGISKKLPSFWWD